MKAKNIFMLAGALFVGMIFFSCSNSRQSGTGGRNDSVNSKGLVDARSFVFIPQYVNPMSGRRRDLSSGYELVVSKDTIISYLPFFGRGYTAPLSPTDIDFDFTSTNFSYTVTQARQGWNISIKPRDKRDVQELYLKVYDNAAASLNITSMDRSSISYDGYITERKQEIKMKK